MDLYFVRRWCVGHEECSSRRGSFDARQLSLSFTSYIALIVVENFSRQPYLKYRDAECQVWVHLLLPCGVQVFLSTLGIWCLNPWACTHASAFYISSCCCSGYQFPLSLVSHLPSHEGISDTTEHFGLSWLFMCKPFSSALTWPNSEAPWKVSSLAMSFLLGCNCLLLLPILRTWAGILLSSFCLDRAGGNVWSLLQEMFLCFFNLQNKAVKFFANAVLAVCVPTGFILAG